MKKVAVKVELYIVVEFEDDYTDDVIKFIVEENSCPGTNVVGSAIEDSIEKHEKENTCWGCALRGKNTVLNILHE